MSGSVNRFLSIRTDSAGCCASELLFELATTKAVTSRIVKYGKLAWFRGRKPHRAAEGLRASDSRMNGAHVFLELMLV